MVLDRRGPGRCLLACLGAGLLGLVLSACTGGAAAGRAGTGPTSTTTPAAVSPPSTPSPGGPRSLTLVATGDVLLHPALWAQAHEDAGAGGDLDFAPELAGVRPLVSAADLAICHLETPLAPAGGPFRGYPQFAVPPQIVQALDDTGYDACSTASNHSFDAGAAGIDRTLDALDAAGIAHAGTARTEQEAGRTTLLDVPTASGPVRVALLSYAFGFNGVAAPGGQTWRGNLIDEGRVLRDAASARAKGARIVVAALHWGDEYVQRPSAQQLALAPRLIASPDIDLLISHHTHVVEPVERFGDKWVAYGLGNLVAAHSTPGDSLREGLLVRFRFTERPDHRFVVADAGYAPLLVTATAPLRVLDVATTARAGGAPGASPARLADAWSRTTAVVDSRGAVAAGLVPLSTP